jgi:hypothetical protein
MLANESPIPFCECRQANQLALVVGKSKQPGVLWMSTTRADASLKDTAKASKSNPKNKMWKTIPSRSHGSHIKEIRLQRLAYVIFRFLRSPRIRHPPMHVCQDSPLDI